MAKDGTRRGGARIGAGRKKKPLAEKLQEGKKAKVLKMPGQEELNIPKPAELERIREFLSEEQKLGELYADKVYKQTWEWLCKYNCEHLVIPHLLEQYAMAYGRWVQCERIISEMGMLMPHPTTGKPVASPFVTAAQAYLKQSNLLYQQIFSVVSENSAKPVTGDLQEELMEKLLGM